MADSHHIVGDQVVPYCGGRMSQDTNSWRDATDIEMTQQSRIERMETALSDLIRVAEQCDSWESFPQAALDAAESAMDG